MSVVGRVQPMEQATKSVSTQTSAECPKSGRQGRRGTKVVINVGGNRYTTSKSTLTNIPDTTLCSLDESHPSYMAESDEYYFDRNPNLFNAVLDAYRIGKVHIPQPMCGSYIKEELDFWGIPDDYIAPCCWRTFKAMKYEEGVMDHVESMLEENPSHSATADTEKYRNSLRWKIWVFLEDPTSSLWAMVYGICFLFVVLVAVSCQVMLTHPMFRHTLDQPKLDPTNITNTKLLMFITTDGYAGIEILEDFCVAVFVLELFARFCLDPFKLKFLKDVYNIVDILATVPSLMYMILEYHLTAFWDKSYIISLMFVLSFLSIFRVLRLMKFTRHYTGMKVLLLSLRASVREIALLFMIMTMGTLIYATLIYFAEFYNEDSDMTTIPIGFWWSIITMTTVGYGEKVPSSSWGYIVGTCCAISGMFCTGLPIPIIANNFTNYYRYAKAMGGNFKMKTSYTKRRTLSMLSRKATFALRFNRKSKSRGNPQNKVHDSSTHAHDGDTATTELHNENTSEHVAENYDNLSLKSISNTDQKLNSRKMANTET